ncbi:acylphosphatase [Pseudenhygromyxa sp. WMMC2535]|uniref:acylphosphatase n=1 Tax=Pseudenhygromyxa sp. WMMC2535 TaxID=2712867 RepID=UPI0015532547|nr:acylphosphatase [Pseudenhygromyxa sp. WMMC2535]NVB41083.1 acylphosphatase [Pseudenhygromyxa sp. WMMC2535]
MSQARRVHLRIRGRVQGVYYRASTREQAAALGLRGWVRNRPDGSVELVAEGEPGALEALLAWCAQGPPAAQVSAVETQHLDATGEFADFQILR